jgi:hypothetical protein
MAQVNLHKSKFKVELREFHPKFSSRPCNRSVWVFKPTGASLVHVRSTHCYAQHFLCTCAKGSFFIHALVPYAPLSTLWPVHLLINSHIVKVFLIFGGPIASLSLIL